MRIYRLVNQDPTGYLLSEDTVPKVLKANESPDQLQLAGARRNPVTSQTLLGYTVDGQTWHSLPG